MHRGYLITILLLILALIFAIQNTVSISLSFLIWSFTGSQALIIVVIFFFGFLGGWLLGLSSVWKKNAQLRAMKKQMKAMQPATGSSTTDEAPHAG